MNRQKWTILLAALLMMAAAVSLLAYLRGHQRLGRPGVKTRPLPGSIRLRIELPEQVLDYTSKPLEVDKLVLDFLPPDTSFGQRCYIAPDHSWIQIRAVLMGTDRTSLHKPEICLGGSGLRIDDADSNEERIPIPGPRPYDLPVMKLVTIPETKGAREQDAQRLLYVYWFVADGERTARHSQRMWWMVRDMLRTGVLQRWAYIAALSPCAPGQEQATFERMKKFIAAAVPQFQL
ncbi:MAG: exosortase-associated EpsI family protein [Limisphaerales bacterium]